MRRLQLLLLLLGITLFVLLVRRVGLEPILAGLSTMGWSFAAIFAVELLIDALHSEGWRWCLHVTARHVPRHHILMARTAGVAVNVLTPTASVGGEVLKGMLLRRWIPLADGFASVMVDKLTFAVAQALFLFVGAIAVFQRISFDPLERAMAIGFLVLWIAAVMAFFLLQRAGIFRVGVGVMRAIFGGSAMLERLPIHAAAFDAKVAEFLRTHRFDFWASVGYHLLAQAARAVQLHFALGALGLDASLATCFTTAAGLVFMEATMFLVPAKLGVFESGNALIFARLGFGATAGLVVSFTMRLSELASALLGLVALGYYHLHARQPRHEATGPATVTPDPEATDDAERAEQIGPRRRHRRG